MDHSPLGKLPAELRNKIYELTLRSEEDICLTQRPETNISLRRYQQQVPACDESSRAYVPNLLALTQTCKRLRAESHIIFFNINSFYFPSNIWTDEPDRLDTKTIRHCAQTYLAACIEWLQQVGPEKAHAIRRWTIEGPHMVYWYSGIARRIFNWFEKLELFKAELARSTINPNNMSTIIKYDWHREFQASQDETQPLCSTMPHVHIQDITRIIFDVPMHDLSSAQARADDEIIKKQTLLQMHSGHQCCLANASFMISALEQTQRHIMAGMPAPQPDIVFADT